MKKLLTFAAICLLVSCNSIEKTKIPCYAWLSGPGNATDAELEANFNDLKAKGIDGLMYSGGQDPETYKRVVKLAKKSRNGVSYLDNDTCTEPPA